MTPKQIDAMKMALEALKKCHYYMINAGLPNQSLLNEAFTAYKALEALKEHAMQEVQRLGQEIEQKPVAHCKVRPLRGDESFPKVEIDWVNQPVPGPLYTSPPQRTWVGLTGIDQKELMAMSARDAVFATEAKLKEKNT